MGVGGGDLARNFDLPPISAKKRGAGGNSMKSTVYIYIYIRNIYIWVSEGYIQQYSPETEDFFLSEAEGRGQ